MSRECANETLKGIYNEPWYFGLLSRSNVEAYLTKKGDFCVRAAEKKTGLEIILYVKGEKKIHQFEIKKEKDGYTIPPKPTKFKDMTELIQHFKNNAFAEESGLKLLEAAQRPKWYLKRNEIKIDKKLLGSGNFCDVYRGMLNGARLVAIKICHASEEGANNQDETEATMSLVQEATVMSQIRHPNVITFYGICCDRPPVSIAMELCPGGSLVNHLQKQKEDITNGERIKFACEASDGMTFLHTKDLVHRDLAARNCLISKIGVVKISDFGLSRIVSELNGENNTKCQVPLRWMAPESLVEKAVFAKASDVWAFGVLLYEVFNLGEKPWPDWENRRIATHIRKINMPEFPERTPAELKKMVVEGLWIKEPEKRLTFEAISKKLAELARTVPAPQPEDCSVGRIPEVRPMSLEELAVIRETAEDIAIAAIDYSLQFQSFDEDNVEVKVKEKEKDKNKSKDRKSRRRDSARKKRHQSNSAETKSGEGSDDTDHQQKKKTTKKTVKK